MGSATYLWMVRHSERVARDMGSAWPYTQPTWVFSHRILPPIASADIRFVAGDVRPVHAAMVRAAGLRNVWVVGGGDLAGQFHDAGLLDEVILQVASVTLGRGKPLFPRRVTNPPWTLVSARRIGAGFAELRYAIPRATPEGAAGGAARSS